MRNLILGVVGGIVLSIIFIDSVRLRNEFYKTSLSAGRQIIEWRNSLLAELDRFSKVKESAKTEALEKTPVKTKQPEAKTTTEQ